MPVKDAAKYAERPLAGLRTLTTEITEHCRNLLSDRKRPEIPDDLAEKIGLHQALCELAGYHLPFPELTGKPSDDLAVLGAFFYDLSIKFNEHAANEGIKDAREKYLAAFRQTFHYEFSDGDLAQIQKLLNELRNRISTGEFFNENHRERLLKKLEELQAELHKRMSNLEKIYALAGEGSVLIGKYGANAKPLLDIIKVILRIAWMTQGRAEELPSNAPSILIPTDDQEIV